MVGMTQISLPLVGFTLRRTQSAVCRPAFSSPCICPSTTSVRFCVVCDQPR
jgi:hypothetical protein